MRNVDGRKFTEKKKRKNNKVEEFQLAKFASLGSLASNDAAARRICGDLDELKSLSPGNGDGWLITFCF